ncbi:phosphorylase [Pedobacter sp. HMF7647]|uniref:Uridine phosphorylase n=1 Tax=Hufsiella arboris TaxID=2695275 RepID=A0A7K1YC61_9SPHI|nr:nucleoside phosphorylase [Hufsiella arboris]MXV52174.1 phosphorylase [Hufsiella arboris]
MMIAETDLILNADGSIYHLNLLPEDIAETIITVGDPERVGDVSKYFDRIEVKKGKREFITHTGYIGSKRITVVSTGIGTDNIDIVFNELDALVNIDFKTRTVKPDLTRLEIVRIGTSGTIQPDIPIDSILVSEYALGLDNLMTFYVSDLSEKDDGLAQSLKQHVQSFQLPEPYVASCNSNLLEKIGDGLIKGITLTAPGFYAPQGREVRAKNVFKNFIEIFQSFNYQGTRVTNLEMETAGIYALAGILNHKALSVNAILASRAKLEFSKKPYKVVDQAIKHVLEKL